MVGVGGSIEGISRCHSIDMLPKLWLPHLSGNLTNLSQIVLNFAQQPEFYLFV